jgi:hypothetical protein
MYFGKFSLKMWPFLHLRPWPFLFFGDLVTLDKSTHPTLHLTLWEKQF